MRYTLILFCFLSLASCRENSSDSQTSENDTISDFSSDTLTSEISTEDYLNESLGFSLEFPQNYQVLESELPGNASVINLYPENSTYNPPFAIHEEPDNPYIAILPKGFGVDAPSGSQSSLAEWSEDIDTKAELDEEGTKIYLLESGEAWAYFLRFTEVPENWEKYGGIFVHFKATEFEAKCFSSSGAKKPMDNCDPMGSDQVRYSGQIDQETKAEILAILGSFNFKLSENKKKPIADLIKVNKPLPNKEVTSPLKIEGRARGYWFFEADAPVEILNKNFQKIGESYIKAEGEWMTEDFVPFSGSIEFDAPDDERGFLLFKRANPSDKPENDREYRIPVIFPPKS